MEGFCLKGDVTTSILKRVQRRIRVPIVTRTANEAPERALLCEIVLGSGSWIRSCVEDMWGVTVTGWLAERCESSLPMSYGVPVV